jgi:Tetratricopeptide repeat
MNTALTARLSAVILLCAVSTVHGANPAPATSDPYVDACKAMVVSPPVRFHGKLLNEIPDITEPELRLANQLISAGCEGLGYTMYKAYAKANPSNLHATYVEARFIWMRDDTQRAEMMLKRALLQKPDFHSAKVLLAGIRFEQGRFDDVRKLLDEVEKSSPADVWIYMNRLRLEVLERPTRQLRARLLEIVRNPKFPPNVRDGAASIGQSLPNQNNLEVEEFMRASIDVESWSTPCKISALAERLSEVGERFDETRKLLESPQAIASGCLAMPKSRMLLAQAYLFAASKIAPQPTAANQELVDKATELLQGNYAQYREYLRDRPQEAVLEPFMHFRPKPEVADSEGHTPICNAVRNLDIDGVISKLNFGADANGRCDGRTLMGHVMYVDTNDRNRERQAIIRALMQHDGEPAQEEVAHCSMQKYGDCWKILLPIVQRQTQ